MQTTSGHHRTAGGVLRLLLLLLLGAGLVGLILQHSGGAFLSRSAADRAVRLGVADAGALVVVAEQHLDLGPGRTPLSRVDTSKVLERRRAHLRDEAVIENLARQALRADPLNARALRLLGEVADARGDAVAADLMQSAVRVSGREAIATEWMFRFAMQRKDYATAMRYADKLLRAYPGIVQPFVPYLAAILDDPGGGRDLTALLAQNPPWRRQFMTGLMPVVDARLPLQLFVALKGSAHPPTTFELSAYLSHLVQQKRHELAYYAWLQFLPPEQLKRAGFLYNGNFESDPTGLPFDWSIGRGSGVNVEIVRSQPNSPTRELRVVFGEGRADFRGVSQHVLLSAGRYRFKAQFKGNMVGRRGLEWRVYCADVGSKPLGRAPVPLGTAPQWSPLEFDFVVPEEGCRAQIVQMLLDARSASEQLVQGELWFKSLEIARNRSSP